MSTQVLDAFSNGLDLTRAGQKEKILHMLRNGPVTLIDALEHASCFRLAARIRELREYGHQIETRKREVNTLFGATEVAEYHLVREAA